ncbi:Glutamate synthase [NADPH] large chain [hydrothermal vent metagenome]|uniref:Glutamate synthase [NADPH] large chain n=1 Tax=hydrothermal vent metagenome TaxID=652676 RepID=A0A3B0WGT0_9ZZZZ
MISKNLLIIGYVWPEPNSSAAGTRMMQLILLFQANGWQITFATPAKQGDHKTDLQALGIKEHTIKLNSACFDQFIQTLQPQLVMFDRFMMEEQFGWRIEKYLPKTIRLLNTEDLHCLRATRQTLMKSYLKTVPKQVDLNHVPLFNQSKLFKLMATTDLAKREIASIFRCDLTLMISEFEMDLLQQHFQVPKQQLCYLPFLYPNTLCQTEEKLSFQSRQHFIAIGNFRHDPNWDAVLWLKQTIWPRIRQQLPQAELHVYGAYPPPKATQLHNDKQGFKVKGWAPDALHVIRQARVCLAPLRFGAGIKGKLAESMLCGTPNVTTSIGSESMQNPKSNQWGGEISNNTEQFVQAAVQLYSEPEYWKTAQQTGFNIVQSRYTVPHPSQETLFKQLSPIIQQPDAHRQTLFIGAILNHHHHKSTQYMAQWIEAKNRD